MTVERLRASLSERYTLESELGQGGMATVYLARDVKHDRQVAVKVLRPELSAILGRERFLAEVRNTAKLDHPHILTLLDSGESDGFVWYTLPYIRGESLRHKLDRETQLSVEEAVSITRQIAGALEHAHQHGIIHRDVKPENILLHEGEAMLADFGIALAVKEAGGQRLTETGLSLGTPQYMSPEQATAEKTLDARSDVYSLGAVLYEMLAGEPPFTGATGQAVIAKLLVERPSSLRTVRDTIPTGLEAVVARALAKVPADRFPSAAAFAAALAAPETQGAPRQMPKRALLLGGAAVVGLVLAGVWLGPKLRSGRGDGMRGEPVRYQITFSGNTSNPALSPDGKQLAYGAETCHVPQDCTTALMLENLSLGEHKILADGLRSIYRLSWSPDQKFLLFTGARGESDGLFLVSTFGGREEYLGKAFQGGRFLGSGDTIIATQGVNAILDDNPGGATRWFPLLSRDGRRLDSIPFNVQGVMPWPIPSPDGRRILIWSFTGDQLQRFYLIDRAGRLTDSLPFLPRYHAHMGLEWTASGDGVLMLSPADSVSRGLWTLLRFAVSAEGRVQLPPDTVFARLRLEGAPSRGTGVALSPPSLDGDHALALVTERHTLTTLERPSISAPPSRKANLITGLTGGLWAWISPDGEQVLVTRSATLDGQPATQLEVWPFSGGTGRPLGAPRKGFHYAAWGADSRVFYRLGAAGTPGLLEHTAIEASSGRVLVVATVPDSLEWVFTLMRDSLLLYQSVGQDSTGATWELRTYTHGTSDPLVFRLPGTDRYVHWEDGAKMTRDAQGAWLIALITSVPPDTGYFIDLLRPGGPAERVMRFTEPWPNLSLIHEQPGPVLEVVADLRGGGQRRLLVQPGRPPRDLGPMPFRLIAGKSSFSADGRRGVTVETERRTDIWLLKWPGGDSAGVGGAK
jgi:tRNA A-37 threonylcarbamoyl transferase component Bud32